MKFLCTPLVALAALGLTQATTPQGVVEELLAVDRGFAAAGATTTVTQALSAMFADNIMMPTTVPTLRFARSRAEATEALNSNPANVEGRVHWVPIRGGVSADGQHGFTIGYMTLSSADGKAQSLKYVAYWTKRPDGWRVAAYRRSPASQPPASSHMMPPASPSELVAPTTDRTMIGRHKASLEAAEKAFSDEAQTIGLGPAFAKHGSADAVNVGPPTAAEFIVGAEAIARSVGAGSQGQPSPVSWAADEGSLVASSGDLGVTFGYIRPHTPSADQPAAIPFFTIWRRPNANMPWRYVAE